VNCTVPEGIPPEPPATEAVNVTYSRNCDGFELETRTREDDAGELAEHDVPIGTKWPAGQSTIPVPQFPPAGHGRQEDPPPQYVPALQIVGASQVAPTGHARQESPPQYVPALQAQLEDPADEDAFGGHAVQPAAPAAEVWPAAQDEHDVAPLPPAKVPATQFVHDVAPMAAVKVPALHERQVDDPVEGW
jgi:hypothetical protein